MSTKDNDLKRATRRALKVILFWWKLWIPNFGTFFFGDKPIIIPQKERAKHLYLVGSSGCGKSEFLKSLILSDIVANKGAIVVIDPNGDFAEQIAKFKENALPNRKDKLIYIDPFLDNYKKPIINPFDIPNKQQYYDKHLYTTILEKRAGAILVALEQIFIDLGSEFTTKMTTYLYPTICAVLLKENSDIRDLLKFFTDRDTDIMKIGQSSPNQNHRDFFYNYDIPKQTCDGIIDKLRQMLMFGSLAELITGQSTIDLETEINNGKMLVFNLSKGKLGEKESKYYGKFIISLLKSMVFARADTPERDRVLTQIYIDEFQNYVNKDIETFLTESRKYNVQMHLASQIIGQNMKTSDLRQLSGNTHVKVIGSNTDPQTWSASAEYLGLKKEEVASIKKFTFMTRVGNEKPILIKSNTKNLGFKNSMSSEQWKQLKANLLDKYYRKPSKKVENIEQDNDRDDYDFTIKYDL